MTQLIVLEVVTDARLVGLGELGRDDIARSSAIVPQWNECKMCDAVSCYRWSWTWHDKSLCLIDIKVDVVQTGMEVSESRASEA